MTPDPAALFESQPPILFDEWQVEPSIWNRIGNAELRADLNATGFHFESLAIHDLRVYAQPLRGEVDSWRDSNSNQVDAVVSLRGRQVGRLRDQAQPEGRR